MASTAVFGVSFEDIKGFPINDYNPKGRNLGHVKFFPGGVSRNVCTDFAHCGMPVNFISITDRSVLGNDVINDLNESGVGTDYIRIIEKNGVGVWMVVLDQTGDVAGSISQMPDVDELEHLIDDKGEEIVSSCENIILEIDMNETIAEKVLNLADKYNKNVYVVVGNMSIITKHPEYLSRVSCFICNEIEAGKLFGKNLTRANPKKVIESLVEGATNFNIPSMVVTMGSAGAVYYDSVNNIKGHCPAIPTILVDSTGAGDAFLSGMVMGLTRGYSLDKAVQSGTLLASKTIRSESSFCPINHNFFDDFEK